ncbi:hypothetical protein SISSUDRAFT_1049217 [Sistotremastrum suecicum HHB10207 ss-3]|uniref:Uncharacterized protein n=1 Tax=Sistotremastrum suecicum HHB10207 ss-3 TaxID=1314776 RepID=A0A166BZJ7_9AGAM|nr:hypothetical protein SISSUDRAFT_1049217 [Sistotremastrum suecicum HHB10207 ss-3]
MRQTENCFGQTTCSIRCTVGSGVLSELSSGFPTAYFVLGNQRAKGAPWRLKACFSMWAPTSDFFVPTIHCLACEFSLTPAFLTIPMLVLVRHLSSGTPSWLAEWRNCESSCFSLDLKLLQLLHSISITIPRSTCTLRSPTFTSAVVLGDQHNARIMECYRDQDMFDMAWGIQKENWGDAEISAFGVLLCSSSIHIRRRHR